MKFRKNSFGQSRLTIIDKFGTWLSRLMISRALPKTYFQDEIALMEIGCGYDCKNLKVFEKNAKLILAIDFKINSIFKNNPKYQLIEKDAEQALEMIGEEKFDLILLVSVLEHIQEPQLILNKLNLMLKEGGILLINVPTWSGKVFLEFSAFKLGLSPKEEMDDHKYYYSKKDLWPLIVKAGFRPSRIKLKYHKFGLNLFCIANKY